MLEHLTHYKVVLASGSPRRKELLASLGLDFEVRIMQGIDESYPATLKGADVARYIATSKGVAYQRAAARNELIITADTVVEMQGDVLGKPRDKDEACEMLRRLSGKAHHVHTGVCLSTHSGQISFAVTTEVTFTNLTEQEILHYTEQYAPIDKAGAYGIQEWIGYIGVASIKGCFYNVMGLPLSKLYEELKKLPPLVG